MILWIRAANIAEIQKQRRIDRCVFPILHSRCSTLTHLSESNRLLRRLTHVLAVVKTAKTAGVIVPGLNVALATLGGATEKSVLATIRAIGRFQDLMIQSDQLSVAALMACGFPQAPLPTPFEFSRPQTIESQLLDTPPPLEWVAGPSSTAVEILAWDFHHRSFGACKAPDKTDRLLDGEPYEVDLRKPRAGRQALRAWSFWR